MSTEERHLAQHKQSHKSLCNAVLLCKSGNNNASTIVFFLSSLIHRVSKYIRYSCCDDSFLNIESNMDNKELVKNFLIDLFTNHSTALIDKYYPEDHIQHSAKMSNGRD